MLGNGSHEIEQHQVILSLTASNNATHSIKSYTTADAPLRTQDNSVPETSVPNVNPRYSYGLGSTKTDDRNLIIRQLFSTLTDVLSL